MRLPSKIPRSGEAALAPSSHFRRSVLGVTGSDFFGVMVPRGRSFSVLGKFVLRNYRDHSLHPLVLDLLSAEQVTLTGAVPTVWLGVLQCLEREPKRNRWLVPHR